MQNINTKLADQVNSLSGPHTRNEIHVGWQLWHKLFGLIAPMKAMLIQETDSLAVVIRRDMSKI